MNNRAIVNSFRTLGTVFQFGTVAQCVAVVIGCGELDRQSAPAIVARGEAFVTAFASEMNANLAGNEQVNRAFYVRLNAAITYADAPFTVQSRKGLWEVIARQQVGNNGKKTEKTEKASGTRMVSESAVKSAAAAASAATQKNADESIATLKAQVSALTADRDALRAIAEQLIAQLTAIGAVPCASLPSVAKSAKSSRKSAKSAA